MSTQNANKISVIITAYNHEPYIGQCLDSVLRQKGDFTLEVVLGDDCSSDGTRHIMEAYRDAHSSIVLLPQTENLGIQKNIKRCLTASTGTYLAFCEGDDYWTDEYKLQKQMGFLQDNPACSVCFHSVVMYYQEEDRYALNDPQMHLAKDTLTTEDLIENNYICGFSSCMYPTHILKSLPDTLFDIYAVDWMFNMVCGRSGRIGYLRDWMSVYRIHGKGAWSGRSDVDKLRQQIANIQRYNEFFSYEYDQQFGSLRRRLAREIALQRAAAYGRPLFKVLRVGWNLARAAAIYGLAFLATSVTFALALPKRLLKRRDGDAPL